QREQAWRLCSFRLISDLGRVCRCPPTAPSFRRIARPGRGPRWPIGGYVKRLPGLLPVAATDSAHSSNDDARRADWQLLMTHASGLCHDAPIVGGPTQALGASSGAEHDSDAAASRVG